MLLYIIHPTSFDMRCLNLLISFYLSIGYYFYLLSFAKLAIICLQHNRNSVIDKKNRRGLHPDDSIFLKVVSLQQTTLAERVTALRRDDNVVEQIDIKQCRRIFNTLCESPIRTTRLGSTRRMVMRQDDIRSQQFQGTLHDQTMIHYGSLHTTLTHSLAFNQTI